MASVAAKERAAPLFMLSFASNGAPAPETVGPLVIERDAPMNGAGGARDALWRQSEASPADLGEAAQRRRQLGLLKTWRSALDSPAVEVCDMTSRPCAASILWPPAASALANSGHLPLAQRQNMCSPPVQVAQNLGWMANVPSDKYVDHRGCQAPFRPIGKSREDKQIEKDERRKITEHEELRRRKQGQFFRGLVAHRDEVLKFGRARRGDAARCARACKAQKEAVSHRIEVDEARAGRRRLNALRANDMEAYSQLVEETKNKRLKFLLEETDGYIRDITRKVRVQRDAEESAAIAARGGRCEEDRRSVTNGAGGGYLAEEADAGNRRATSEYYKITHERIEEVRQPSMMVGGSLKEYQLAGLAWLVSLYNNRLNGILADEMGLGKTIQTIALLSHLMEEKRNFGPFLVVAPLSTLSNWANEFAKWAPTMNVLVYKGPPAQRKEAQREIAQSAKSQKAAASADATAGESGGVRPSYEVLLTTYEYVMRDRAVLRKVEWQYIIVDEGHRMKNANSKFAQTLGNLYTAKRRLLLTGTPLQNSLPELWALLNFLLPDIFSSVDTFEGWFNKPFAQFSSGSSSQPADADAAPLQHEERLLVINRLHEVLRPFVLRRVKSAVLGQLPEKVEKVLRCELSAWQKTLYEQIRSSGAAAVAGAAGGTDYSEQQLAEGAAMGGGSAQTRGLNNVLMQLRKCCNHPYLFRTDSWPIDERLVRASGKFLLLDRMLPMLRRAGHRVLLFSQMTALMDLLEEFFAFRGFCYLRLDGSTAADERERRVARFNDPCSPAFIFLLSTRAGGLGLNLASADTVVIFDSDWNPMMDAQAQDRAHRIGQRNDVRVFRLVACSPVEERILARATDKLNMNSLVVEAGKFNKDSRASDRRAMVAELLKEYDDKECEDDDEEENAETGNDDGTGDDAAEDLCETMATSVDELAFYQHLSEHVLTPLQPMTDADVPDWVKQGSKDDEADTAEHAATADPAGRGARKRKDPSSHDQLSDRNFLRLIETGSLEEADAPQHIYKPLGHPGDLRIRLKVKRRRV